MNKQQAEEARLDWALAERCGGEVPPDLATRIVDRHLVGEVPIEARPRSRTRLAASAAMVLGIGAVLTVAIRARLDTIDNAGRPLPGDAEHVQVYDLQSIAALPADTRAVRGFGLDDEMVAALGRLRELESLELHNSWRMIYGMMLKEVAPAEPRTLTDAAFATIAGFSKLRRLDLAGTIAVTGKGLEQLTRLPVLEELQLRFFDTEDEHLRWLAKLPALRRLDLSFNYGFSVDGISHILRCDSVRSLSLQGCAQLNGSQLARLGEMRLLEELDVSRASWDYARWQPNEADPRVMRISTRARELSGRGGAGLTNEALRGFAALQNLRRLDLSGGRRFDTAALAVLRDLANLRSLDLYSVNLGDELVACLPATLTELRVSGDRSDRFCGAVRERLRDLEVLDLAGNDEITDAGIAELVQLPKLRRLDLTQCRRLTPACLESLMRAQQLEELDLRHIGWPTSVHAQRLRQALPRLREVLVSE